jgi:hypothetical protein
MITQPAALMLIAFVVGEAAARDYIPTWAMGVALFALGWWACILARKPEFGPLPEPVGSHITAPLRGRRHPYVRREHRWLVYAVMFVSGFATGIAFIKELLL